MFSQAFSQVVLATAVPHIGFSLSVFFSLGVMLGGLSGDPAVCAPTGRNGVSGHRLDRAMDSMKHDWREDARAAQKGLVVGGPISRSGILGLCFPIVLAQDRRGSAAPWWCI